LFTTRSTFHLQICCGGRRDEIHDHDTTITDVFDTMFETERIEIVDIGSPAETGAFSQKIVHQRIFLSIGL
jgi:hypothetical protein